LIAVITGFIRGLIKEVFRIAAVFCGAAAAYVFGRQIALYFAVKFMQPYFVWVIVSTVGIYLAVCLALSAIAYFIEKIVEAAELSTANRAAGALFGFCKISVIIFFLFYVLNYFPAFCQFAEHSNIQKIYLRLRPSVKIPDIRKAKIVMQKLNELKNNQKITDDFSGNAIKITDNKNDKDIAGLINELLKNSEVINNLAQNQLSELLKNDKFNELVERY